MQPLFDVSLNPVLKGLFRVLQYYPSLNRSKCCSKGICTGNTSSYNFDPTSHHLTISFTHLVWHFSRVLSPNETDSYCSAYTVSILYSIPYLLFIFLGNLHAFSISWDILNCWRCPFCKTPNYAVEYRGVKTKEERSIEQFVSLIY
jgi:hypothetical protein